MATIKGTTGYQTLNGTSSNDQITGILDDKLFGFDGNDTLTGASTYEWTDSVTTLFKRIKTWDEWWANPFGDLYVWDSTTTTTKHMLISNDILDGGNGNDVLIDHKGSDILNGGNGNDTLYVTANTDSAQKTLTGGSGADKFFVDIKGDVTLGFNFDAQRLANFINDITLPDQNLKYGQLASNILLGGLGAAGSFIPVPGAQFAFGWLTSAISAGVGFGFDTAQVEAQKKSADAAVKSYGNSDWGTVTQTNRDLVTIKDFVIGEDNIVLPSIAANSGYQYQAIIGAGGTFIKAKIGTANPTDVIFLENVYRGQANGLDDAQFTGLIADLLNPKTGVIGVFKNTPITGYDATLSGTFAYDQILGSNTAQQMIGGYGDDVIVGNGGDDTLYGGTKSTQGEVFNSIIAKLYPHDGNDILSGGDGNDKLYGETGDDFLNGEAGYDTAIYAGHYTEFQATILGDGKIQLLDTFNANSNEGTDVLMGVEQINFIQGGTYGVVTGGSDNDSLNASPYWSLMVGNAGNDTLTGGLGNDTLAGGAGNDLLTGGAGNDLLTGGAGADKFVFNALSQGIDTITDFKYGEGDLIQISRSGFGATSTSQFSFNMGTGALSFDGQQFATLQNIAHSYDFIPSYDIAIA